MKVHVDQQRCVGSGQCARTVPEVFDQRDEDGIVVLLVSVVPDAMRAKLQKAEELCPSQAIRLEVVD